MDIFIVTGQNLNGKVWTLILHIFFYEIHVDNFDDNLQRIKEIYKNMFSCFAIKKNMEKTMSCTSIWQFLKEKFASVPVALMLI